MKTLDFIIAALLLLLLAFESGCILGPLGASQLNPDQIEALKRYNDSGDVYACILVGGPPVASNLVAIIVPKDVMVSVRFAPDCHAIVETK